MWAMYRYPELRRCYRCAARETLAVRAQVVGLLRDFGLGRELIEDILEDQRQTYYAHVFGLGMYGTPKKL
jgi:hypothetical protein